jgi:iron complex transport system substrate-binding protein
VRPIRSTLVLSLFALSLLVAACGDDPTVTPTVSGPATTGPSTSFPVTITDDDGESVTIDAPPQRIVTFAPSMTEIVFALGLGDKLVGVSGAFDDYPPEAADIEEVGGAGDFGVDPNIEQVVGLEPDLFLTIKGGDQWKRRLRDLDVPVVTLDATNHITGAEDAATATVDDLQAQADEVESAIAGTPRVTCFYETFYPPLYTVGPDTFIYDLLERAGCDPVTSSAGQQYPQWSVEDLVDQSPDVYLVSSESGAGPKAVAKRPGFEAISAVAAGRVVAIDSSLAERPGPRIVEGLRLIAEALHPEAFD